MIQRVLISKGFKNAKDLKNCSKSYSKNLAEYRKSPVWISKSLNPWFNLSFEEFLFNQVEVENPLLFIYRNSPSVIIGRNQNPWQEARLEELHSRNISLVRRRSGGGTVYHDEGNVNYSIMTSRESFDRKVNGNIVADSVRGMGIKNVILTDRHDVCVNGRKVSGSAFRIVTKRAYHHGTMLVESDLGQLRKVLGTSRAGLVDSRAVGSVPSPVTSLMANTSETIDHQTFITQLKIFFLKYYYPLIHLPEPVMVDEFESNEFTNKTYSELRSWEWTYGQTPRFGEMIKYKDFTIKVTYVHGLVDSCEVFDESKMSSPMREELSDWLMDNYPIGKRYT